jgi:hypothetical protein
MMAEFEAKNRGQIAEYEAKEQRQRANLSKPEADPKIQKCGTCHIASL